jgi:hypothetical protein
VRFARKLYVMARVLAISYSSKRNEFTEALLTAMLEAIEAVDGVEVGMVSPTITSLALYKLP